MVKKIYTPEEIKRLHECLYTILEDIYHKKEGYKLILLSIIP